MEAWRLGSLERLTVQEAKPDRRAPPNALCGGLGRENRSPGIWGMGLVDWKLEAWDLTRHEAKGLGG